MIGGAEDADWRYLITYAFSRTQRGAMICLLGPLLLHVGGLAICQKWYEKDRLEGGERKKRRSTNSSTVMLGTRARSTLFDRVYKQRQTFRKKWFLIIPYFIHPLVVHIYTPPPPLLPSRLYIHKHHHHAFLCFLYCTLLYGHHGKCIAYPEAGIWSPYILHARPWILWQDEQWKRHGSCIEFFCHELRW